MKSLNRRDFLTRGCGLVGAASLLSAQERRSNAVRRPERYDDTFIFERKPFTWPGGKTLAVWIIPNVEVWQFDSPAGAAISPNTSNRVPDVINYSWRDYGIRVGLWRIADVLDAAGVRATVALNAMVCDVFPKAVDEMKKRGWEFMGHGITNSWTLANVPLNLLAEENVVYVGDWNNDDQPFAMKVKKGKLFAIPYGMDINDMSLINRLGYTGDQYLRALTDQFDTLYADSQKTARVMGIPLHPFLMGEPWRTPYLKKAIAHFQQHERVWFATGSEIADAYQKIGEVGSGSK